MSAQVRQAPVRAGPEAAHELGGRRRSEDVACDFAAAGFEDEAGFGQDDGVHVGVGEGGDGGGGLGGEVGVEGCAGCAEDGVEAGAVVEDCGVVGEAADCCQGGRGDGGC